MEAARIGEDGQPSGDLTLWDDIQFPFDPGLRESDLSDTEVVHSPAAREEIVEEAYTCDASGAVGVAIRSVTAGYERNYRLGRWSSREPAVTRGGRSGRGNADVCKPQ